MRQFAHGSELHEGEPAGAAELPDSTTDALGLLVDGGIEGGNDYLLELDCPLLLTQQTPRGGGN